MHVAVVAVVISCRSVVHCDAAILPSFQLVGLNCFVLKLLVPTRIFNSLWSSFLPAATCQQQSLSKVDHCLQSTDVSPGYERRTCQVNHQCSHLYARHKCYARGFCFETMTIPASFAKNTREHRNGT